MGPNGFKERGEVGSISLCICTEITRALQQRPEIYALSVQSIIGAECLARRTKATKNKIPSSTSRLLGQKDSFISDCL
jgi:hypothetical protein